MKDITESLPQKSVEELEWSDELVSRYWDYLSRHSADYFTYRYGHNIIDFFEKLIPRESVILDYGSGPGHLLQALIKAGERKTIKIYGSDTSPVSLNLLKKRFSAQKCFVDALSPEKLLTEELRFDIIFLVETIEHCNDEQLAVVIANLHQLLKPEGRVIITTPNDENLEISKVYCPLCNHKFQKWQHVRSWSQTSLSQFLFLHGFRSLKTGSVDFSRPVNGFRFAARKALSFLGIKKLKAPHLFSVGSKA